MPRVDRNLARLTAYELGHTEIDTAIALAECMTLAGELSTDDSPGFLNGVLAAVLRDSEALGLALRAPTGRAPPLC